MPRSILIADSDAQTTRELNDYISGEPLEVVSAVTAAAAQAEMVRRAPRLVIAGTNFPDAPALDLARWVLARPSPPALILLTARADPIDRTVALEMGADDCMSKPIYPRELVARIHSLFRRLTPSNPQSLPIPSPEPIHARGFSVNLLSRHVTLPSGETAVLSATETKVLATLLEHRGAPVSRDELSQRALGRQWHPEERALDQHVASLRRKLFVPAPLMPLIHTVRHIGYTIDADA